MQGNLNEILPQPEYFCAHGTEYPETLCPHALGRKVFFLYKLGAPMIEWAHKTGVGLKIDISKLCITMNFQLHFSNVDTCYEMRQ